MRAAFVYTNPGHHLELMTPVMTELVARGVACRVVSLAELRGLSTRPPPGLLDAVEVIRILPRLRRAPSAGRGIGTGDKAGRLALRIRAAARRAAWLTMAPRVLAALADHDVVVVPNDAAFPYDELVRGLARRRQPFVLLQEGIRFPLPGVEPASAYGAGGARRICAWGEASAAYFRDRAGSADTVRITGSPRFDRLDLAATQAAGRQLLADLGLGRPPLVFLSNPIDDQGFCSTAAKLDLFENFLTGAAPVLDRTDTPVLVRLHPREDAAGFRAAARRSAAGSRAVVVEQGSLHATLASARAAVVVASTVGLDALILGIPLGVLAVPGHGHLFDYATRGVAIPLEVGQPAGLEALLAAPGRIPDDYLDLHLAGRGRAGARVADAVIEAARS